MAFVLTALWVAGSQPRRVPFSPSACRARALPRAESGVVLLVVGADDLVDLVDLVDVVRVGVVGIGVRRRRCHAFDR